MTPRMRLAVRAWPWVLALLVLFPVLAPGFVLSYDMVFVPDLALRSDFLGLGSGLPRAVPSDAVVAVLDELVPGAWLQKLVLIGSLGLAGVGARRLVATDSGVAQLAATSLYVWNPYVAERLGIGHWTVLVAYAALPWIVDAARRLRAGERTFGALTLWLGLSALSPSGGVAGAVVALVLAAGTTRADLRRLLLVGAGAVLVNLPWLVAGFTHATVAVTDPEGVAAFAARSEGVLPLPLTVLGLGGIWNSEVVPDSRLGWTAVVQLLLVLLVMAVGVRRWVAGSPRGHTVGLAVLAVLGLVVALAGPLVPDAVGTIVAEVPGGGLFRDGSRFLLLLALLEVSLFGTGAAVLLERPRERVGGVVLAAGAVLAPLALMPDAAAGLAGDLRPVSFPADYAGARAALAARADAEPGDVLVLPFYSYRVPAWNDRRRALDPLGRFLTPNYLASDDLYVGGTRVAGEDPRARRVHDLLRGPPAGLVDGLRAEGVRWVVLDRDAQQDLVDAGVDSPVVDRGAVIWDGGTVVVRDLGGPVAPRDGTRTERAAVVVAWCAALLTLLLAAATALGSTMRRMSPWRRVR